MAIEYNPGRPRHRLLFSVAHEIIHTFFPDVADFARYRANPAAGPPDEWQLELLCNIGAGEILMPTDTLPMLRDNPLEIEALMQLRTEFGVSTEALLRRATKLASYPVAMFAASRTDASAADSPFKIDYTVPSRAWAPPIRSHGQTITWRGFSLANGATASITVTASGTVPKDTECGPTLPLSGAWSAAGLDASNNRINSRASSVASLTVTC